MLKFRGAAHVSSAYWVYSDFLQNKKTGWKIWKFWISFEVLYHLRSFSGRDFNVCLSVSRYIKMDKLERKQYVCVNIFENNFMITFLNIHEFLEISANKKLKQLCYNDCPLADSFIVWIKIKNFQQDNVTCFPVGKFSLLSTTYSWRHKQKNMILSVPNCFSLRYHWQWAWYRMYRWSQIVNLNLIVFSNGTLWIFCHFHLQPSIPKSFIFHIYSLSDQRSNASQNQIFVKLFIYFKS